MKTVKNLHCFIMLVLIMSSCTSEKAFYVSPDGSDSQSGTSANRPFATLQKARDAIRTLKMEGELKSPVTVYLRGGTYKLPEPFILTTEDSGTEACPITYRAYKNEKPIISGGIEVRDWTKTDLNGLSVMVSDLSRLPEGYTPFEQLWVNGHRAVQARTPNSGYLKIPTMPEPEVVPNRVPPNRVSPNRVPPNNQVPINQDRRQGGMKQLPYAEADTHYYDGVEDGVAVVFNKWLEYHVPFDRIDRKNDNIIFANKSLRGAEADDDYYLEGGRAMLDQPGEWYLDRKENKLYYFPLAGESDVIAVIPSLKNVLRIIGDAAGGQWVENVRFRGLTFSHTTWILPRDSGSTGLGQADISEIEGALHLRDARNCLFGECEITAIGNYGIEIGLGCSNNRVLRCDIHDLGAGGILIGPKIRPRGPREGYKPGEEIPPVLVNPSDACSHNEIADCRIYDGGRYYHCAVGIWIGQSPDNQVHHNEIYNFYYSGISSGWTWGYGPALAVRNIFEYNHIHHIGRLINGDGSVLSDLGGIYTLGDQTGTVIRYNVFHDIGAGKYGGWAIYCDEGSKNIIIENNLCYRCRHACFNQHYGKDNIVRNNIFAFADASVVMLARKEPHTGFILTKNILLSDGTPIYAGGYAYKVDTIGAFRADSNLVWSTAGKVLGAQDRFPSRLYEPNERVLSWEQWQALGIDQHSLIADPGFKDPDNGDFSLPEDSPAIQIGFKPFPLDQAGPR